MENIKHYKGIEITKELVSSKNLIAMRRYSEGYYSFLFEGIDTIDDICYWCDCNPEDLNLILGKDWYIMYVTRPNEIEITEWISTPREKNILEQTNEMLTSMISILLLSEGKEIFASMRHHTSYKFYEKLKRLGYVEELFIHSKMEMDIPLELDKIVHVLAEKYDSLDEYFADELREHFPEYGEYIYHDVRFSITDKFIQRYKKESNKSLK
jgi:hypothetical protein